MILKSWEIRLSRRHGEKFTFKYNMREANDNINTQ